MALISKRQNPLHMNGSFRFVLEKGNKKYTCPSCTHSRKYRRYIDTKTGEYIPFEYGRCDREENCAYWNDPYKDGFAEKMNSGELVKTDSSQYSTPYVHKRNSRVYFDESEFKLTLSPSLLNENCFVKALCRTVPFPFGKADVLEVVRKYRIGTTPQGSVCFPYIDHKDRVHAIQEKIFDNQNHTDKTQKYHTGWTHTRLKGTKYKNNCPEWLKAYSENDGVVSCLFGEHLLPQYPYSKVILVEAPKTAIYGDLYLNHYFGEKMGGDAPVWLAVFNKGSFTFDKLKVLEGRDVYVFPDLSKDGATFNEWQQKAAEIEKRVSGVRFKFMDVLELIATEDERAKGLDIADFLISKDWRIFRTQKAIETKTETDTNTQPIAQPETPQIVNPSPVAESYGPVSNQNTPNQTKPSELNKIDVIESPRFERHETGLSKDDELFFADLRLVESVFGVGGVVFHDNPDLGRIHLGSCESVAGENIGKFVQSHLDILKSNNSISFKRPYLNRLVRFVRAMEYSV